MRRIAAVAVVGIGVVIAGRGTPIAAQKTSNPGVTVQFADRLDDAIISDGHGAYVNGVGGVTGQIFVSGSGDATLNLSKTRPNRVFNAQYTPATDVAQPTANPPSGTLADGWFVNIGHIWQIPVGATESTGASFSTGIGDFRWCRPGSYCDGFASTELVSVTRTSFSEWTVTADADSDTVVGNDLSALVKYVKGTWQAIGYYHMPFQLTIQCSNTQCQ